MTDAMEIAVVGAGFAGLMATRKLRQAGLRVTLYEASERMGGRVHSLRDAVGAGLVTECGAEFIDSSHADVLALANEFKLPLLDSCAATEADLKPCYFFAGKHRTEAEVLEAFAPLAARMRADRAQLSETISAARHSAVDAAFDRLSISDYLQRHGAEGWLRDLLEVAYTTEFGVDADQQSCLNLLTLISLDTDSEFNVFGVSDERYKIGGGNARIATELAHELAACIEPDHRLLAVRRRGSGFALEFQQGATTRSVNADVVVIAIPFSVLRHIELPADLPAPTHRAIQSLGYGSNEKLIVGVNAPHWREQGYSGEVYSDQPYQTGWDSSRQQAAKTAAYTFYLGGSIGAAVRDGDTAALADRFTTAADAMFPGLRAGYNGRHWRTDWAGDELFRGSYSCFKPGQWTEIGGAGFAPAGNLYFAGEHCSAEFQGYMNGALQTGREAAAAIIRRLGGMARP